MDKTVNHLAIIMDGNGRWATARGLSRAEGHRAGAEQLEKVLRAAKNKGVHYVTLYAFSSENWSRPEAEVSALMRLFAEYLDKDISKMSKEGVAIHFVGDRSRFDEKLQQKMAALENQAAGDEEYHVILAMSYGGRDEIKRAVQKIASQVENGNLSALSVTEDVVRSYLDMGAFPDVDLMIRTSGEQRLSNFLPWHLAYAELYFTPVAWPDFDEAELDKALDWFSGRQRRFGKV